MSIFEFDKQVHHLLPVSEKALSFIGTVTTRDAPDRKIIGYPKRM